MKKRLSAFVEVMIDTPKTEIEKSENKKSLYPNTLSCLNINTMDLSPLYANIMVVMIAQRMPPSNVPGIEVITSISDAMST